MNKDLTLDLGLTDDPIIDVSSLNVGLKVGKHAKEQRGILINLMSLTIIQSALSKSVEVHLQQWYSPEGSAPLCFWISAGI